MGEVTAASLTTAAAVTAASLKTDSIGQSTGKGLAITASTLTATGAVTGGSLATTGAVSAVSVSAEILGPPIGKGLTVTASTITASGAVTGGSLTTAGMVTVGTPTGQGSPGALSVSGPSTLASLSVSGESTFTSKLTASGDLMVRGQSTLTGKLTANGELVVGGQSTLTGKLTANGGLVVGPPNMPPGTLLGMLTANGDLMVGGQSTLTGKLTANGELVVGGPSTLTGKLTANGGLVVGGPSMLTANGGLVVSGQSTLTGKVTAIGDLEVKGGTTLSGKTVISGDVEISGNISHDLALNDNTLRIRGATDANHGLKFYSPVDGPFLFGNSGGALGYQKDRTDKTALQWDSSGNVTVNGNLNVLGRIPTNRLERGNFTDINLNLILDLDAAIKSSMWAIKLTLNWSDIKPDESTYIDICIPYSEMSATSFDKTNHMIKPTMRNALLQINITPVAGIINAENILCSILTESPATWPWNNNGGIWDNIYTAFDGWNHSKFMLMLLRQFPVLRISLDTKSVTIFLPILADNSNLKYRSNCTINTSAQLANVGWKIDDIKNWSPPMDYYHGASWQQAKTRWS